jgi:hypothetical protein
MPKVGEKDFPYTIEGIQAAAEESAQSGIPVQNAGERSTTTYAGGGKTGYSVPEYSTGGRIPGGLKDIQIKKAKKWKKEVKREKVKAARKEKREKIAEMKKGKRDVYLTPKGERTKDPEKGYKTGYWESVPDSPHLRKKVKKEAREKIRAARKEKREVSKNIKKIKKRQKQLKK